MSAPQNDRRDAPISHASLNTNFDPQKSNAHYELVLNVMKTDPYPTVTPRRIVERTQDGDPELKKVVAFQALDGLVDAGWVTKRERGLYDLVADPREDVPQWPVPWNSRDVLPDPLPTKPPLDEAGGGETTRVIHDLHRNRFTGTR